MSSTLRLKTLALLFCVLSGFHSTATEISAAQKAPFPMLPEFTHTSAKDWINSEPLTRQDLQGKVVLIDVWTYSCWNCYRSFPWLTELEASLKDRPFTVIGVHTPEFEREKIRQNVVDKVAEFGLHHPVMIDNDFSYWKALGNRYWPAYYLIDKQGKARGYWVGETHKGDPRAKQIEFAITQLLTE